MEGQKKEFVNEKESGESGEKKKEVAYWQVKNNQDGTSRRGGGCATNPICPEEAEKSLEHLTGVTYGKKRDIVQDPRE